MAVDLSRQEELDVDLKAIQHTDFPEQLKNVDGINAGGAKSMFINYFRKNQRNKIKISSRKCNRQQIIKKRELN